MEQTLIRNWGWVVLQGVAAILFALLTFFYPGLTLATLVLLFGAYALVDGFIRVVEAIANRRGQPHWVALLVGGLLGIAAGIFTFSYPALTGAFLLFIIAAWAVVTGISEIVVAIRLRKVVKGEWLLALAGVVAVLFGIMVMAAPARGALALALWIGLYALIAGIVMIALGFRLRHWGRQLGEMGAHPA